MSALLYGVVWKVRLSRSSAKLVLVRLTENAHDDGTSIYPAKSTIAIDTGLARRTVQYEMEALELADIISQVRRGGGRGRTAEYRIDVARLHALADSGETVQLLHPIQLRKGCKLKQERVQTPSKKGAMLAPEPLGTLRSPSAPGDAAAPGGAAFPSLPAEHEPWNVDCECNRCIDRRERRLQERLAAAGLARTPEPAGGPEPVGPPGRDEDEASGPNREPALIHVRDGTCRFRQRLPRDLRRGQDDCLERSLGTTDLSVAWALRPRAVEIAESYFAKLRAGTSRAAADRWLGSEFAQLRRDIAPPLPEQLSLLLDGASADTDEAVRA